MKFKNKFTLLKRNTVTKEIGGQSFTFYPISVRMLFELRTTMEPTMQLLRGLMTRSSSEQVWLPDGAYHLRIHDGAASRGTVGFVVAGHPVSVAVPIGIASSFLASGVLALVTARRRRRSRAYRTPSTVSTKRVQPLPTDIFANSSGASSRISS